MNQLIYERIIKTGLLLCLFLITQSCSKENEPIIIEVKLKVGVFGGSVSSSPESKTVKDVWKTYLNIDVKTCGVGGAGFSSLTYHNVPYQIEKEEIFDVYILWDSTNDMVCNVNDSFNKTDETSQTGGIWKSLEIIRRKNSNALILFFTSLPRFDSEIYLDKLSYFVENQIYICEQEHIPYLDQYHLCPFNKNNYMQYYLDDGVHLSEEGYASIALMQMEFIRENMKEHKFK